MTSRIVIAACLGLSLYSGASAQDPASRTWNRRAAAAYLDSRAEWWSGWPTAVRDQGTFCVSCHTSLPYALARPALRTALGEPGASPTERKILDNVARRITLWNDVQPFYSDERQGVPKTFESRGTEAVLNALIEVSSGDQSGALARQALENMRALQLKTGDAMGAWPWLNFHNEPWEADDSQFWGAALAAIALGKAPAEYRSAAPVQENLRLLGQYLRQRAPDQSLLNRAFLLWASALIPGLLPSGEKAALVAGFETKQLEDGGWSSASLVIGSWKRRDGTPLDSKSDGYATGLVSFALEQAGVPRTQSSLTKALAWLSRNQDKAAGFWPATSLNKQRDPQSDAARFMSDAATAYSVLALTDIR
jgi:squalene-hopene/tetraprenyl-beta-curcumene cyclase